LGSLQHSPDPLAGFARSYTSKRGEGKGGEESALLLREGKEKRGRKKEGA